MPEDLRQLYNIMHARPAAGAGRATWPIVKIRDIPGTAEVRTGAVIAIGPPMDRTYGHTFLQSIRERNHGTTW